MGRARLLASGPRPAFLTTVYGSSSTVEHKLIENEYKFINIAGY